MRALGAHPRRRRWSRGVSLMEVLVTIIIGSIAMMGLGAAFMQERFAWLRGRSQVEAQRDAQVALQAISRCGREGASYTLSGAGSTRIDFSGPFCGSCFEGGPAFNGGQLVMTNNCDTPTVSDLLIDGNDSWVAAFTATAIDTNLLRIQLDVVHRDRGLETLETEVFLRNAS